MSQSPTSPTSRTQNAGDLTDQVRDLAQAGWGRNAIARELGVSNYRVNQAAKQAGVVFDRSATHKAVQARSVDAQAARVALSAQFQEVARLTLDKALETLTATDLDTVELRELVWVAGSATASDVRLAKHALDVLQVKNTTQATEDMSTIVEALSTSITQITSIPDEELLALIDRPDDPADLD